MTVGPRLFFGILPPMHRPFVFFVAAVAALASASASVAAAQQSPPAARPAPRGPVAAIGARTVNPAGPFARLSEHQRDSIVDRSRALLGVQYKWAGATPERGVDCSGLVQWVFARVGVHLPHSSALLARLGLPVDRDTATMQPGDLLVFSKKTSRRVSHVGIYVGDGMMVHASSTSKRVVEVPVSEFRGLQLRGVRRVFSLDTSAVRSGPTS
jgi:peptidoglycan DL-endopeptidase CwlO